MDHLGLQLHPVVGPLIDPEFPAHVRKNLGIATPGLVPGPGRSFHDPDFPALDDTLSNLPEIECLSHLAHGLALALAPLVVVLDAAAPLLRRFLHPVRDTLRQLGLLLLFFRRGKRMVIAFQ